MDLKQSQVWFMSGRTATLSSVTGTARGRADNGRSVDWVIKMVPSPREDLLSGVAVKLSC